MPHGESKPRVNEKVVQVGAVTDITVHRPGTPKFSARVTEFVEKELVKAEFFEGDLLGTGEWPFEQIDGKTKVRFRWNVVPERLLFRLISPFVNIGKVHSGVMKEGFKALNRYLSQR